MLSCCGLHIFYVVGYSSDRVFLNWAVFIHVINLITVCSLIENSSCDRGGLDKIYTVNNVIEREPLMVSIDLSNIRFS